MRLQSSLPRGRSGAVVRFERDAKLLRPVAAVAFQGYGIVSLPLSAGRHVIKLYEPYIIESPVSYGGLARQKSCRPLGPETTR